MFRKYLGSFYRILLTALLTFVFSFNVYASSFNDAQTLFDAGDYKKALLVLEPLAKNDDVDAQNLLGLIYAKGNDTVPVNDMQAVFWFNKAAKQGHDRASKNLAYLEANGRGSAQTLSNDTADEDDCED